MNKISLIAVFLLPLTALLSACEQSSNYEHNLPSPHHIPAPLTEMQTDSRLIASQCAAGGIMILHGLDHDGNGHLSPYEQLESEIVCNVLPARPKGQSGIALSEPTSADKQL